MSQMFDAYPDMMTVEQLAQALNIGRTMAYRLVRSGAVQSVRFGVAIRIPEAALLAAVVRKKEAADHGGKDGVVA